MLEHFKLMLQDAEYFKDNFGDTASSIFQILCGLAIFSFVLIVTLGVFIGG